MLSKSLKRCHSNVVYLLYVHKRVYKLKKGTIISDLGEPHLFFDKSHKGGPKFVSLYSLTSTNGHLSTMATFFFPQGGRHGCREVQLYFETGSSSFPNPTPPLTTTTTTDGALGQNLQFLNVELTDLFLEFLWGPLLPLELFCRPVLWLEEFTRHGLRHFFYPSQVLFLF